MRFFAAAASLTALLSTSAYALPQGNTVLARSASPEAIAEAIAESADLLARAGKDIKYGAQPTKDLTCPATNNGNFGNYPQHKYTTNQIKAAFVASAKLSAQGKQVGPNNYPHKYNSNQALPNNCGSSTQEFPIQTDNVVYNGGAVNNVPDRVLYELKDGKKDITVKFCGVIRHGPGVNFLNCP